jgi:hypothetical protein
MKKSLKNIKIMSNTSTSIRMMFSGLKDNYPEFKMVPEVKLLLFSGLPADQGSFEPPLDPKSADEETPASARDYTDWCSESTAYTHRQDKLNKDANTCRGKLHSALGTIVTLALEHSKKVSIEPSRRSMRAVRTSSRCPQSMARPSCSRRSILLIPEDLEFSPRSSCVKKYEAKPAEIRCISPPASPALSILFS